MSLAGRLYRVEGRVQGVWFRESTRRQAQDLGITGHALNQPDGSVEVAAYGRPEALVALEQWLREGPPLARVSSVTGRDLEGPAPEHFSTA